MLDEIPKIEIEKISIEANSILVCYTDGIVELENNNRQIIHVGWNKTEVEGESGNWRSNWALRISECCFGDVQIVILKVL